jgi:hypothetical protein
MTAINEDEQIYPAVPDMEVWVRASGGGGQLTATAANGAPIPVDPALGVGELRLGLGSALKGTTVDIDAAFLKTNTHAPTAFLNLVFLQRVVGTTSPDFRVESYGPFAVPFGNGTVATRQTSVSII